MLQINTYALPQTPQEAWELNQVRANRIVAGMMWLRLSRRPIATAIDLSGLGLHQIQEKGPSFWIGCMTSLRTLETHDGLNDLTQGAFHDALHHIVGVQFRNTATAGGSVYGRYGFSDLLTLLMALNATVTLFQGGEIPLERYVQMPYDRDLLLGVSIPKSVQEAAFSCVRNAQTDFSVLNCAMAEVNGNIRCAIGARPGKAMLLPGAGEILGTQGCAALGAFAAKYVPTGENMRATAQYRTHLAQVLARRLGQRMGGSI